MTVSDYILDYLSSLGIKKVFVLTGGAIAFVIDAFSRREDIEYICVQHEQSAAMAADAYSRMGPGIAATMVTSGPGATNLITGICCSWFDSIPVIHISGQVHTNEQKGDLPIRQLGFQETDIVSMVRPITKLAEQLDKPENIRYLLEKATYMATSGRAGPVLIDIPINFQQTIIEPKKLKRFTPPSQKPYEDSGVALKKKVSDMLSLVKTAKRPIILAGGGVRLAHAEKEIREFVTLLNIPLVTSWSGFDLFEKDFPHLIGEMGVTGNRGANFAVQNTDLLITVGSRLDTRQIGGKPQHFARAAKKIFIDIDKSEIVKNRGLTADITINADAKEFLLESLRQIKTKHFPAWNNDEWQMKCRQWKSGYPSVRKEYYKKSSPVNVYVFMKTLSDLLGPKSVIIPDDGGNLCWTMQGIEIKKGQRLFSAFGNSPMGYALPAAIGASFALGKKEVICIDGDGSLQLNIQELQTIIHYRLPIKLFIIHNNGYGIIKQFQDIWLNSRYEATGKGYSSPDFLKISKAYGLKTVKITSHTHMRKKIQEVLREKEPVLCEVHIPQNQKIIPKLEFGKPIEDLSPFLPRREFKENMLIPTIHDVV